MTEQCRFPGCDRPATRRIISGCVGEHVHVAPFCDEHFDFMVQAHDKDVVHCRACLDDDRLTKTHMVDSEALSSP